jgi:hypothetical protein
MFRGCRACGGGAGVENDSDPVSSPFLRAR